MPLGVLQPLQTPGPARVLKRTPRRGSVSHAHPPSPGACGWPRFETTSTLQCIWGQKGSHPTASEEPISGSLWKLAVSGPCSTLGPLKQPLTGTLMEGDGHLTLTTRTRHIVPTATSKPILPERAVSQGQSNTTNPGKLATRPTQPTVMLLEKPRGYYTAVPPEPKPMKLPSPCPGTRLQEEASYQESHPVKLGEATDPTESAVQTPSQEHRNRGQPG